MKGRYRQKTYLLILQVGFILTENFSLREGNFFITLKHLEFQACFLASRMRFHKQLESQQLYGRTNDQYLRLQKRDQETFFEHRKDNQFLNSMYMRWVR